MERGQAEARSWRWRLGKGGNRFHHMYPEVKEPGPSKEWNYVVTRSPKSSEAEAVVRLGRRQKIASREGGTWQGSRKGHFPGPPKAGR